MSERAPGVGPLQKTADSQYEYTGYHTARGVCRIRVFAGEGRVPAVVATELPENTNTSITNMAEILAAAIIARHLPERFEEEHPVTWIEHSPRTPREKQQGMPEYALVEFASYRPRRVVRYGGDRVSIGTPRWQSVDEVRVAKLIGQPIEAEAEMAWTPTTSKA